MVVTEDHNIYSLSPASEVDLKIFKGVTLRLVEELQAHSVKCEAQGFCGSPGACFP